MGTRLLSILTKTADNDLQSLERSEKTRVTSPGMIEPIRFEAKNRSRSLNSLVGAHDGF